MTAPYDLTAEEYNAMTTRSPAQRSTQPKALVILAEWLEATLGNGLCRECRFHPTRKWRFDFCDPDRLLAIEYQGTMRRDQPGHLSVAGAIRDHEKINEGVRLGWAVFQADARNVENGTLFEAIDDWLDRQDEQRFGSRNVGGQP